MTNTISSLNTLLVQSIGSPGVAGLLLLISPTIIMAASLFLYRKKDDIRWYLWGVHAFEKWEARQRTRIDFLTRCGVTRAVALSTALAETIRDHEFIARAGENPRRAQSIHEWMQAVTHELKEISRREDASSIERASAINGIKLHKDAIVTHEFRKLRSLQI